MEEMMNNVVEEAIEETVPTVVNEVVPTVAASEIPQVAVKPKSSKMKLIVLGLGIAGIVFRRPIKNAMESLKARKKAKQEEEARAYVKMTIEELEKAKGEAKPIDAEIVHDPSEDPEKKDK